MIPLENQECDLCGKKAKYLWFRENPFSIKIKYLCEEHKMLRRELK